MDAELIDAFGNSGIEEVEEAIVFSELAPEELALVAGGMRGCGLIHIDK